MKINKLIAIITSFLIATAIISCGKKDSNSPKAEQISSDADKRILGVWDFHKVNIGNENYVSNDTFEFKKDSIIRRPKCSCILKKIIYEKPIDLTIF